MEQVLFFFLNYLSVTVDGYYNDVTDKIVAFPTTYAWKMANYGKFMLREWMLHWRRQLH